MLKLDQRCIKMSKKKDISASLLGVYEAMILWITVLGREPQLGSRFIYPPFHTMVTIWRDIWHMGIRSNFLGNMVMFVPIGILLPIVLEKHKWYWTVGAGLSFSCTIEIMQLVLSRGCFDPDDMILNTLGTTIGYGFYRILISQENC